MTCVYIYVHIHTHIPMCVCTCVYIYIALDGSFPKEGDLNIDPKILWSLLLGP